MGLDLLATWLVRTKIRISLNSHSMDYTDMFVCSKNYEIEQALIHMEYEYSLLAAAQKQSKLPQK